MVIISNLFLVNMNTLENFHNPYPAYYVDHKKACLKPLSVDCKTFKYKLIYMILTCQHAS